MERLKNMKETLMCAIEGQLGDLCKVDAEELGEVVDMVKDLSEAIYYCSVTKAMEERKEEEEMMAKMQMRMPMSQPRYYSPYPPIMYADGASNNGSANSGRGGNRTSGGRMYYEGGEPQGDRYHEMDYPTEMRDYREGRSPITRRMYMESKELKHGKEKQMQELEKYMKELTDDILEMIEDATPEEKTILNQKLSTLASKIR